MYKKLKDVNTELNELRTNGNPRGKSIGWDFEILPYTVKEGCTTYIGAAPASGKTELWFEFLINLSCLHGWKHVIFSPETGDAKDIFAELCYKYIGKPYLRGEYGMNENERTKSEYFISEHFIVVDPEEKDLTLEQFYDLVDQIERDENITINTTTIDPWNELTEDFKPNDLGREDKYLSRILGYARKNAKKTNRHNCIINHVRDQAPVTVEGHTYYPPPSARDFAGGQVWFRKGLSVLIPWRPIEGLTSFDGAPCEKNEVHLKVAKSKPKGVSKNGTYKMFLDLEKYQYYMKDIYGNKIYAQRFKDQEPKEKQLLLTSMEKRIQEREKRIESKNNDLPF